MGHSYPISVRRRALVLSVIVALTAACSSRKEPEPPAQVYREAVTAFYVGLSAMQTTQEVLARQKFDRLVAIVPEEPAGWADLGLLLVRQQELDQGAAHLARAAALAPDSAEIQRLQAIAEGRRGRLTDAIAHWRRALELAPEDAEAAYALALETERQGGPADDAEAQRILAQLLGRRDNLAARLEFLRIAAKRGDQPALAAGLSSLAAAAQTWSPEAQAQLTSIRAAAAIPRSAATPIAFLKNVLLRESSYRAALAEVSTAGLAVGRPVVRFLKLKNPAPQAALADEGMTFATESANAQPGATWISATSLDGTGNPLVLTAGPAGVRLPGAPRDVACRTPVLGGPAEVAVADLNYDFRVDLALAGPTGVCLLRQDGAGGFTDVTAASTLPATVLRTPAVGVWPADLDTDGDLDLVVASRDGAPVVLRNNGDGTFSSRDLFRSVNRARGFIWADLDGEGVPDAAFVDQAGEVRVFVNQRGGQFRAEPPLPGAVPAVAIAAAEVSGDAIFDLLVLARDGTIRRVSRATDGTWRATELARTEAIAGSASGVARLLTADLDNNGATDLIVAGPASSRVLLGAPAGSYAPLAAAVPLSVRAIADLDGDGRLDLLGLGDNGLPTRATSRGTKAYHWQVLRPRAATATGDQRINSFGFGGEVELRSGLHAQKQVITAPLVHFGLGEAAGADVVRITWPNGALQAEFGLEADQAVAATQRLKGSCPWLFGWNGQAMSFVTDLLWRSPLGLRINAQATADVLMTEDWVKVRGDQLAPRDGAYDLRVTAELWETHFFDLVSLLVVDHPADTEIFLDERFAVPPPAPTIVVTTAVQPFASVTDDRGHDASALASVRDDRYLDFAGRGPYQGITRPHFVELTLPDTAPRTGPLWLVAQGWIHPTDSSINVAISQGAQAAPESLALHVADANGRFRVVRTGLGFPAGKDKTILLDLSGLFGPSGPRRIRLATNLEIFWDRLGWAVGRPDVAVTPRRLELAAADLVYRGYSITDQARPSVPERARYTTEGTGARWRDLEGYYTRFGDVRPLLGRVDDRYVIMNAGDELRLRFPEAPAPSAGLIRDFVVVSDGWEKDGDYNTTFSRTVLPLPTHASGRYNTPPGQLEDDPVYRKYPDDFAVYHTRYVTSDPVRDALRATPGASGGGTKRP
ncbi:MAG: CRTAC1 family protein [Vicinamibacterales bacterium]